MIIEITTHNDKRAWIVAREIALVEEFTIYDDLSDHRIPALNITTHSGESRIALWDNFDTFEARWQAALGGMKLQIHVQAKVNRPALILAEPPPTEPTPESFVTETPAPPVDKPPHGQIIVPKDDRVLINESDAKGDSSPPPTAPPAPKSKK